MKTIIFYCSKTGFTERYAKWLAEELDCSAVAAGAKTPETMSYDIVIFASWFHVGTIRKLDWFKKLPLEGKQKIVLATGAVPMGSPMIEEAMTANFKDDRKEYRTFYAAGGLNYEKMGWMDRLMMKAFVKMVRSKKEKSKAEEQMEQAIGHSYDLTRREYLKPLVDYWRELQGISDTTQADRV